MNIEVFTKNVFHPEQFGTDDRLRLRLAIPATLHARERVGIGKRERTCDHAAEEKELKADGK